MKANKRKKKAFFFTLSMFLLVTAVLSLAVVIFHYTSQERIERTVEISSLDRLFDLSGSVEQSLLQIFNLYSDVDAVIVQNPDNTTNVSITEKIIRKEDWGEKFEEEVENFETFVESRDENVKLDIGVITDKELPLTILPHNITYSRSWETGHPTLHVVPERVNFNSYNIIVDSGNAKIDNVLSQFGATGSFYFGVRAIDAYGNNIAKGQLVDPDDSHQIQVFFVGGNKVKITLDSNELEIWTNSEAPITVITTLDRLEKSEEKVRIGYLKGAINVTFPSLGVSRIGYVLID